MRRCEMLASPIKIGKLTLKNKMMSTSMSPEMAMWTMKLPPYRCLIIWKNAQPEALLSCVKPFCPLRAGIVPPDCRTSTPCPAAMTMNAFPALWPWQMLSTGMTVYLSASLGSYTTGSLTTSMLKSLGAPPRGGTQGHAALLYNGEAPH